jgi:hypothetical protein
VETNPVPNKDPGKAGVPAAATLLVPTPTVPDVESDDVVDPGDAALQALLATIAENTRDHERREKAARRHPDHSAANGVASRLSGKALGDLSIRDQLRP